MQYEQWVIEEQLNEINTEFSNIFSCDADGNWLTSIAEVWLCPFTMSKNVLKVAGKGLIDVGKTITIFGSIWRPNNCDISPSFATWDNTIINSIANIEPSGNAWVFRNVAKYSLYLIMVIFIFLIIII